MSSSFKAFLLNMAKFYLLLIGIQMAFVVIVGVSRDLREYWNRSASTQTANKIYWNLGCKEQVCFGAAISDGIPITYAYTYTKDNPIYPIKGRGYEIK